MTNCKHPDGDPDCPNRACRTRWLVGSTTGEPFRPAPIHVLIADVLETWCGAWFTDQQLVERVGKIRPTCQPESVQRMADEVRKAGGATVGGTWVPVESKRIPAPAFSTSTGLWGWVMRVETRVGLTG